MAGINDGSIGHGDWETLDDQVHVYKSCIGCEKMTGVAGVFNSKGKGNWGGTCCCNVSARYIRSSS